MLQEKIMIVDNEMEIIQLLRLYLSKEGYNVIWTTDSNDAKKMVQCESPDLILLDVVMPGQNGIELCSTIREISDCPILFISCKGQDSDVVLGLSVGGDDYIAKPFSPMEVIARVKAHLRRQNLNPDNNKISNQHETIDVNDLKIDLSAHTVCISGKEVYLTAKEFELLVLLCKYPNRVFTYRQIFDNIWESYGLEEDARTVMVHISNLRKKIESNPETPQYIHTVRGVGYKMVNGS